MNDEGYEGSATTGSGVAIAPPHIRVTDEMVERARVAINELNVTHLFKAAEGHPWAEEFIARTALEAALATATTPARQADTPSSEAPPESRELERLRAIEKAAREVMRPRLDWPRYLEEAGSVAGALNQVSAAWAVLRSALHAGDGQ